MCWDKRIITNTCVLRNSKSIDDWHIQKRGHLLKHYQIQLYHWYFDFCLIFNGEYIYKHCLTGIPKLETFDENMHGMSTDNKRQLVLFDVTGLPIENVPIELATCFREVLDNGGTSHAEPYGESAPSPLPWPELHEVGGGVILPCNNIIRHLPSTYDQKLSLLSRLFPKRKQEVPQDQCHINRISMNVYIAFFISDVQYKTLICYCYFIRMLTPQ